MPSTSDASIHAGASLIDRPVTRTHTSHGRDESESCVRYPRAQTQSDCGNPHHGLSTCANKATPAHAAPAPAPAPAHAHAHAVRCTCTCCALAPKICGTDGPMPRDARAQERACRSHVLPYRSAQSLHLSLSLFHDGRRGSRSKAVAPCGHGVRVVPRSNALHA